MTLLAAPASATFHQNEITKVMVGYNGDTSIQAVEIKMLTNAQHFVNGMRISAYDADANLLAVLGTFTDNVNNGTAGRYILCATQNFRTTFGIIPDLIITPGLPVMTGQAVFEADPEGLTPCLINALPYGAVITKMGSPTSAPALPAGGATALVRLIDNAGAPSCPLAEDANLKFRLTSGNSLTPLVFTNNAGQTANVFTTQTGVDGSPPAVSAIRVYPNPIRGSARVEAPSWAPLTVHDLQGRLVRVLTCTGACPAVAGPFRGEWDGRSESGQRVPSGIYFIRYAGGLKPEFKRVALLR